MHHSLATQDTLISNANFESFLLSKSLIHGFPWIVHNLLFKFSPVCYLVAHNVHLPGNGMRFEFGNCNTKEADEIKVKNVMHIHT
jgi:hypothetical protein